MTIFLTRLLTSITKYPRYIPEAEWSSNSWTHNAFRIYELIFGRRFGIKAEMSAWSENGKTYYACHSWESVFALTETYIRDIFRVRKLVPFKIWVPILSTPQGPIFASPYLFAIVFDAAAFDNTSNPTSPATWSHTCTGSNGLIIIDTWQEVADTRTVTYNSVACNVAVANFTVAGSQNGMYFLCAPTTGSNTCSVTFPTAGDFMRPCSVSYSGVKLVTTPDSTGTGANTGTTHTVSTTVVAANCWLMSSFSSNSNSITPGTGTTYRISGFNGLPAAMDSNGTVGIGSQSLVLSSSTSEAGGGIVASFAPATPTVLSTNTIAYWKLDGNSNDATGNGNNGSNTSITYNTGNGKINQGAGFGGSSVINTGNVFTIAATTSFTFACWMKSTNTSTTQFLMGKYGGNTEAYILLNSSNHAFAQLRGTNGSGESSIEGSNNIADGNWHHIVYVRDVANTQLLLYVDGVSAATPVTDSTSGTIDAGDTFYLGKRNNSDLPYTGDLDEIGVWLRPLSATEVVRLWANGGARQWPFGQNAFI